ncbi:ATP-binding protein [Hymenobacter caeli]|uniref:histidine kinase n=1 Tax=Hymenobacter caeli TaxID=2735894 RepID=A0ABX2FY11_9BACT|nr:ATP-binding protein [Hymenobacter caeli]NRT21336.1 signal transduction histidine kinase [Hymenobacter caeli]
MFASSFCRVAAWLVVAFLVLGSGPVAAQHAAAARYRYWEADPDSLRQVLRGQRADTARLRTLMHLADVLPLDEISSNAEEVAEAAVLSARLHRPEQRAYRLLAHGNRLYQAKDFAPALDTLEAAVAAFDRLGRPIPMLLSSMRLLFNALKQQAARGRYYQEKLAYYQQRGATENMAACHQGLGGYYRYQGDYNQSLGHYLQDVALLSAFNRTYAYRHLVPLGTDYAEWGNTAKALHYLQQAVAGLRRQRGDAFFAYKILAEVYVQRHDYPAALRALDQALVRPKHEAYAVAFKQAYVFALRGAVLLAQGHPAPVRPLLQVAQHLADSLSLPLSGAAGNLELDATWARYYAARGEAGRAETYWLAAYHKAGQGHVTPLRLRYLRALTRFYQQHGQPVPAARYAVAALALADSLDTREGALHVARYEIEQADRAQTLRIASLRQAQALDVARARRQRWVLGAVLTVLALIGGFSFLLWRSNRQKQRANAALNRLNEAVTAQKSELQTQRDQLDTSLTKLRATQAQLIQAEKMASLGELTAGIAHEIQNPLNFVNNFSEVSAELVEELEEEQARPTRDPALETELLGDLKQNLVKITEHGQRAASIVRGMLEHSRQSSGERAPTDMNALADEYLRLAYQGLRAKDKTFNAALQTDFAPDLPLVEGVGADLGRVLLNLFNNAFYAVQQRQRLGEAGYVPTVRVATRGVGKGVEIRVSDNGTGMSPEVQAKIFQPFFTTKPTGEGTGLGLSLAHDIIAQGHGGTLSVESQEGQGTEFVISLPL